MGSTTRHRSSPCLGHARRGDCRPRDRSKICVSCSESCKECTQMRWAATVAIQSGDAHGCGVIVTEGGARADRSPRGWSARKSTHPGASRRPCPLRRRPGDELSHGLGPGANLGRWSLAPHVEVGRSADLRVGAVGARHWAIPAATRPVKSPCCGSVASWLSAGAETHC